MSAAPVDALLKEAGRHHQAGRLEEARALYAEALRLQPGHAVAMHFLGVVALQRGDVQAATLLMEKAIAARDDVPDFHANLALCYRRLGRVGDAIVSHRRSIALDPLRSSRHSNLAVALQEEGQIPEALAAFDRALELDPQNAEAHYSRSLAHLLLGDYARGWAGYEWRSRCREFSGRDLEPRALRPWHGEPLEGTTLLVRREQGHGDTIQLLRFLPLLADRGARVRVEVPAELAELAGSVDSRVEVVAPGTASQGIDFYVNLMSVPGRLAVTADAIPNPPPYLVPDPERVGAWRERMSGYPGRKIGLAWAGNPHHHNDRNRSCPLAALAPLFAVTGLSWFSLQLGSAADALALPGAPPLVDLRPILRSYSDTAAAMEALDLVISVDTSVAHLGGALARPAWVLIPHAPDWRWFRERGDSPWYPTLRLFRQEAAGDWGSAIAAVRAALDSANLR
jgi:tetratricopeptide (TPR) repeat protein